MVGKSNNKMSKITTTIWRIDPHTEAKHTILRKYLDAWLPIITKYNKRVNIIDGFAGPGEYFGGEDGSPIIIIRSIIEHKIPITSQIHLVLIENDLERFNHLQQKLATLTIPKNIVCDYKCENFSSVLNRALDRIEGSNKKIAPTFAFIDPFGFNDIPFSLIKKFMSNEKCEVFITFMYEEINRFLNDSRLEETYTNLFGTDKWKVAARKKDSIGRFEILHQTYMEQLRKVAKFVKSFKIKNKSNKIDYFLFFGTNGFLGLERMKDAMWRVDSTGRFEFSDATYHPHQTTLLGGKPNYEHLKQLILNKYQGKKVLASDLKYFVVTETPYLSTHYKNSILRPMEREGKIKVASEGKRRAGSYLEDAIIEFL